MKNIIFLVTVLMITSLVSNAQNVSKVLGGKKIRHGITSLLGGQKLTSANLQGNWIYVNPVVKLKGDNVIKNMVGNLATKQLEDNIREYFTAAGIEEGVFNYNLKSDSTFTNKLKNTTLQGTYSVNNEEKTITFKYKIGKRLNVFSITANAVLADDEMVLLFEAHNLFSFIKIVTSISDNVSLKLISQITNQYDGLMIGFNLNK